MKLRPSVPFLLVLWGSGGSEDSVLTGSHLMLGAITSGFTAMLGLMAWVLKKMIDNTIPQQQSTFTGAINKLLDQTIPSLQSTFSDSLDKHRNTFTEALSRQSATFTEALERQKDSQEKLQGNFQGYLDKLQGYHREEMDKERTFYREVFKQQLMQFHEEEKLDRERFLDTIYNLTTNLDIPVKIIPPERKPWHAPPTAEPPRKKPE